MIEVPLYTLVPVRRSGVWIMFRAFTGVATPLNFLTIWGYEAIGQLGQDEPASG